MTKGMAKFVLIVIDGLIFLAGINSDGRKTERHGTQGSGRRVG